MKLKKTACYVTSMLIILMLIQCTSTDKQSEPLDKELKVAQEKSIQYTQLLYENKAEKLANEFTGDLSKVVTVEAH